MLTNSNKNIRNLQRFYVIFVAHVKFTLEQTVKAQIEVEVQLYSL
jgi:hypothetical protein